MTRWALTGGSGYIASALAAQLRADGADVRLLSRREPCSVGLRPASDLGGRPEAHTTRGGANALDVIVGDIRDRDALARLVTGADVVVHLAAYVHRAVRTRAEHDECRGVIAGGTAALVDAIGAHAPSALLINISTASVYAPSRDALTEDSPLAPETPYGEAKLEAEQLVRTVRATTLRPAMVLGPNAPGNFDRLVAMVRRGLIVEVGGGRNRKSILPVETLVEAILAVARQQPAGETFNVAGGDPLTMHEIARCIAEALNRKPLTVSLPLPLLRVGGKLADGVAKVVPLRLPKFGQIVESYASSVVLDDTRLRERLGLVPSVDVRSAIASAALSAAR